jgi:hypothetical protein
VLHPPVVDVAAHSSGSWHVVDTYSNCISNEFEKSAFEPQNVEQGILNIEVPAGFTSAVRNSLSDIPNLSKFCFRF